MMTTYRVRWELDVTADDAVSAARAAREEQRNPETTALLFEVVEINGSPGEGQWLNAEYVDLSREDER